MKMNRLSCTAALAIVMTMSAPPWTAAVTLEFAGSQANLDNGFFPGGQLPYVTAYWRSDTEANVFAVSQDSPNRYYGTAGYALFGTTFTYPDANELGGQPNLNPDGSDPLYPNIISTPSMGGSLAAAVDVAWRAGTATR